MLVLQILLCATLVAALAWGNEADGESPPAPTSAPLYQVLEVGASPLVPGVLRGRRIGREGRLDARQFTCNDPGYILSCPVTENKPCCPLAHPLCCHDPSDTCCSIGAFCCGNNGCCWDGQTCCNGRCCDAGYECRNGQCASPVDPQQSRLSVQSQQSVQSREAVQQQSEASVQSVYAQQSWASVQSVQSVQNEEAAASSRSVQSSLSVLSIQSLASLAHTTVPLPDPSPDSSSTTPLGVNTNIVAETRKTGTNAAVVGGAVGGSLGAIILALLVGFFCLRKKNRNSAASSADVLSPTQQMTNVPHTPSTSGTAKAGAASWYGTAAPTVPAMVYNINEVGGAHPYPIGYDPTALHQQAHTRSPSNTTYDSTGLNPSDGRPLSGDASGGIPMWVQRPESHGSSSPPPDVGRMAQMQGNGSLYPNSAAAYYSNTTLEVGTPPPVVAKTEFLPTVQEKGEKV